MVEKEYKFLNLNPFASKHETFSLELEFNTINVNNNFSPFIVLTLFNKYYGSYGLSLSEPSTITFDKIIEFNIWENLVTKEIGNIYNSEHFLAYLNPSFFIQNGDDIHCVPMKSGVTFSKDKDGFQLTFYPKVFTNEVSFWDNNNKLILNQSISSGKNRQVLRNFIKELEITINGNISNFWSTNIALEYIEKYGIKETAVLLY